MDTWSYEFAHYIPSRLRADGFGCSNGPELDVSPPRQSEYTSHGPVKQDSPKDFVGKAADLACGS